MNTGPVFALENEKGERVGSAWTASDGGVHQTHIVLSSRHFHQNDDRFNMLRWKGLVIPFANEERIAFRELKPDEL